MGSFSEGDGVSDVTHTDYFVCLNTLATGRWTHTPQVQTPWGRVRVFPLWQVHVNCPAKKGVAATHVNFQNTCSCVYIALSSDQLCYVFSMTLILL